MPEETTIVTEQLIALEGPMSALGQKPTYALQQAMSALPPIATAKADDQGQEIRSRQQIDGTF
jgi:hypothetical protein